MLAMDIKFINQTRDSGPRCKREAFKKNWLFNTMIISYLRLSESNLSEPALRGFDQDLALLHLAIAIG